MDKYLASGEHRGAQRLISSHEPCLSVTFNGVCVRTHTRTHTYIHPGLHTDIHTSIHAKVHTCIHPIFTFTFINSPLHITPAFIHIHTRSHTPTLALTFIFIPALTHIHNQTHTYMQTHFYRTTLTLTLVFTLMLTPIHPHSLTYTFAFELPFPAQFSPSTSQRCPCWLLSEPRLQRGLSSASPM